MMEHVPLHTDPPARPARAADVLWGLLLLMLASWQGWMTLTLFVPHEEGARTVPVSTHTLATAWNTLLDERPIVSGAHPLHLYHGYLGAVSLLEYDTFCCYDPAFQAGYPKTPVFDGGSRPAELFLALTGGTYQPHVYKLGFALCLLGVPWLLWGAARGVGLTHAAACLATGFGLLVLWGVSGRQLVENGELDLLLASLAGLLQVGLLLRFHRHPGVAGWLALALCGCLGWFAQPALYASLSLLVLAYYLSVGARHRISWHLALGGALACGLVVNGFWLPDWLTHWWIRSPLRLGVPLLPHRTLPNIWGATLWGDGLDRVLAGVLLSAAAVGVWLFHSTGQRAAARVFALGTSGLLFLAVAGLASEALGTLETTRLLVPALWFAAFPAAQALTRTCHGLGQLLGSPWRASALVVTLLAAAVVAVPDRFGVILERATDSTPLLIGLNADRQAIVDLLSEHTTPRARILWEDHPASRGSGHWTALLPVLTGRAYISGLDIDRCIEHAYPGFTEQTLAGQPVGDWTDSRLEEFTRRYAIGWVACWSPAAVARFRAWSSAEPVAELPGTGQLFALRDRSFALRGQATLLHADCQRIVLGDVVPDDEGKVVLSLHYQAGLRALPSRVQVEREPDAHDPIPFVRLRLSAPVARVTLTWQGR